MITSFTVVNLTTTRSKLKVFAAHAVEEALGTISRGMKCQHGLNPKTSREAEQEREFQAHIELRRAANAAEDATRHAAAEAELLRLARDLAGPEAEIAVLRAKIEGLARQLALFYRVDRLAPEPAECRQPSPAPPKKRHGQRPLDPSPAQ